MAHRKQNEWQTRERLAQAAAQYMAETGSQDFQLAKKKAMLQLGMPETRNLPSNIEIETALQTYQRLFRADTQPQHLQRLRQIALTAMQFFQQFDPRLVGPVLSGTADEHSSVTLHVFSDTPEDVAFYLMDKQIPYSTIEKRLKIKNETYQVYPAYHFIAEDTAITAIVFPMNALYQAPISPVDGKPMQRANAANLINLLDQNELTLSR